VKRWTKPSPTGHSIIERTVARVIPGSGRNAFTARALDLAPGEWQVTATPVPASAAPPNNAGTSGPPSHQPRLPHGSATGTTTYAPVARVRAPGVRIGAWPAFVAGGTLVALTTQALLADHQHLPAIKLLLVSLIACLLGLVGAKVYYAVPHLDEKDNGLFNGMCIQGFVLAAIGTLLAGALVSDIPVGRMLDVTTPGLLLGLSIGRLGCLVVSGVSSSGVRGCRGRGRRRSRGLLLGCRR
jgi:phosphatidylglycerol:prolipoprotein diacylglycerol transferase